MWAGSRSKRHGGGHAKAKGARNDAGGMSNLLFQTHRHDESPESSVHGGSGVRTPTEGGAGLGLSSPHGAHTPGGHPAHKPSTLVRSWSRRSFVENSVASKWFYSSQVLATVVDGYRDNLEARLEVSRGGASAVVDPVTSDCHAAPCCSLLPLAVPCCSLQTYCLPLQTRPDRHVSPPQCSARIGPT